MASAPSSRGRGRRSLEHDLARDLGDHRVRRVAATIDSGPVLHIQLWPRHAGDDLVDDARSTLAELFEAADLDAVEIAVTVTILEAVG